MELVKSSASQATAIGVRSAFNNIRDTVAPLDAKMETLLERSLVKIESAGFAPADTLIRELNKLVSQSRSFIGTISDSMNTTDTAFGDLNDLYLQLGRLTKSKELSKSISPSDTMHSSPETASLLSEADMALTKLEYRIGNLSAQVATVKHQITESAVVNNIHTSINEIVSTLVENVHSYHTDYNDSEIPQKLDHYYRYVQSSDKIRLPLMILALLIPIILFGLWFVGIYIGTYEFLLVGFWWAALFCWVMMILAAAHIALFIPVNEFCHQKETMIVRGLNEFVWTDGPRYASVLGIDSPQEVFDAINIAVERAMAKLDVVLDCKGDESFITLLDIDMASITDLKGKFDSAKADIREKAQNIDLKRITADAPLVFQSLKQGIQSITDYNDHYETQVAALNLAYSNFKEHFTTSMLWNTTTEESASAIINDINGYIRAHSPPYSGEHYAYKTITHFDPTIASSRQDREALAVKKDAVMELLQLQEDVEKVKLLLVEREKLSSELKNRLSASKTLADTANDILAKGKTALDGSKDISEQICSASSNILNGSLLEAKAFVKMPGLGKCAFVGDFGREGLDQGLCSDIKSSLGGVAISILLLSILWLVSWPLILSSKTLFTTAHSDHFDDFFAPKSKVSKQD